MQMGLSQGRIEDLWSLEEWLSAESELRGRVTRAPVAPGEGKMGALSDVLVVALGSGGALTVLAASLKVWLSQPRGVDVKVTIESPSGVSITLDAQRVEDVDPLLRRLFEAARPEEVPDRRP